MRSEDLHDLRLRARLTQRELSEKSGVPQTTISKIENGHVQASALTLAKLQGVLGEDPCRELLQAAKHVIDILHSTDTDFSGVQERAVEGLLWAVTRYEARP